MKLARDVYGWPRLETHRLHIELGPDWLWSPRWHLDADDWPILWHSFLGFVSLTWVER